MPIKFLRDKKSIKYEKSAQVLGCVYKLFISIDWIFIYLVLPLLGFDGKKAAPNFLLVACAARWLHDMSPATQLRAVGWHGWASRLDFPEVQSYLLLASWMSEATEDGAGWNIPNWEVCGVAQQQQDGRLVVALMERHLCFCCWPLAAPQRMSGLARVKLWQDFLSLPSSVSVVFHNAVPTTVPSMQGQGSKKKRWSERTDAGRRRTAAFCLSFYPVQSGLADGMQSRVGHGGKSAQHGAFHLRWTSITLQEAFEFDLRRPKLWLFPCSHKFSNAKTKTISNQTNYHASETTESNSCYRC